MKFVEVSKMLRSHIDQSKIEVRNFTLLRLHRYAECATKLEEARQALPDDLQLAHVEARILAAFSLLLWAGAVTSGRFLAYTYNILMASHQY